MSTNTDFETDKRTVSNTNPNRAVQEMGISIHILFALSSFACVKSQYLDPTGQYQGYALLQPINVENGPQFMPQQQFQYAPAGMQQGIPYYPSYPYQNAVGNLPLQQQQQQQLAQPDAYSNVKSEIIDVDPNVFRELMAKYKFQPQIVSYEPRAYNANPSNGYHQPGGFSIRTETRRSNKTSIPSNLSRHEVQNKVYSFNKTFVIHPDGQKNQVLNLNFVNGVQVTDAPDESVVENGQTEEAEISETTVSPNSTIKKDGKRFIDVPEGCEEGSAFASTGGCFSPFQLNVTRPQGNNTELVLTRANRTKIPVASPRRMN